VCRFFFPSPEVGHKLGMTPEFVTTGDFTTATDRVRGNRRLHRTSARVFDPKNDNYFMLSEGDKKYKEEKK
jgi:hypothetical protein